MNILWRFIKHLWRFIWYRPFLLAWGSVGWLWLWCVTHAQHVALPLVFFACVFTSGCIRTEAQSSGRQVERREFQEQTMGSDGIPVTKTGSETITRESESSTVSKTGLDEAAIAGLVSRGVQAAMGNYAGALAPRGNGTTEALAGGIATTALAGLLAYVKHREAMRYKADADEGWERAAPRPGSVTTMGGGGVNNVGHGV